jgi:hypothetical protein
MPLTAEEGRRLHVLRRLERGRLTTAQADEGLGLTPRQVRRLRRTLQRQGPEGLAQGNRGRQSPHRLPDSLRAQIVALTEKLTAVEGLPVSRATARRILRAGGAVRSVSGPVPMGSAGATGSPLG